MKGMDSFEIKRELTLDELAEFMEKHWDKDQYGDFVVGHPTAQNSDVRYVMLPATEHWCVIIYPKSGGLFSKKNQIKASCTYTTDGALKMLDRGGRFVKYNSTEAGFRRAKNQKELNDEMRGEGDAILHEYMDHLRSLMEEEGLA